MNVNLKAFREQYEATLATGIWHLEGGSVKRFSSWWKPSDKSKQIQTMSLDVSQINGKMQQTSKIQ